MDELKDISKYYKAISDITRLKILEILLKQNKCICVCELAKETKKNQSVIYKHIQILKEVKLINTKKEDKFLMCCIKDKNQIKKILNLKW